MSNRHGGRNEDPYRDPNRHSSSRNTGRDSRDSRDERSRKEPKNQGRAIREEPMDVDMDDNSDGPGPYVDRHRSREQYSTTAPSGNAITQTTSRRRHRPDSPDEPERPIIPLNPERGQPPVRPGSDRDFWIPNEGIDRDVITYEITRYLGQDALVRPGKNDVGFLIRDPW
jgi:hypothetical protein